MCPEYRVTYLSGRTIKRLASFVGDRIAARQCRQHIGSNRRRFEFRRGRSADGLPERRHERLLLRDH
jgi:hypothetical protein